MKNFKILAIALTVTLSFSSCDKDDDNTVINEEELITTVTTTLSIGDQIVTLTSRDLDGDGPGQPEVTVSGPLSANTTYLGMVQFLNEAKIPVEDITQEVAEEGEDHQVFYRAPAAIGAFGYTGTDNDDNGKPIGLRFTLQTGATGGSGIITVTLRHLPNKSASGVADGDITNAQGATDAEVMYPVTIAD
ncbi:MAG TPA: type 1 periplasmic binding fold superfamily protein [Flavobacterium sp.]|jgi:hypothetical protein